jgi:phosphoglycolate phosphatase-like HAD superfamily hydrolase
VQRLILDADGVFLSERPYWNAALATACHLHGMRFAPEIWDGLAAAAFERVALQRVTKARGCNSNYDFAAVLARALGESEVRRQFDDAVAARRFDEGVEMLAASAASLYRAGKRPAAQAEPLHGFGISRSETFYERIVELFCAVNRDVSTTGWAYPRVTLKESADATARALQSATGRGYELWVCTSRDREDITDKIDQLALNRWLDPARTVTATDAVEAQNSTGVAPLGKPHWFPAACATVGFGGAVAMVQGQPANRPQDAAVYAGDAPADFLSVSACNQQGLPLSYIHVRSGVTGPGEEAEIAAASFTRGVVDDLAQVVSLLDGARS